MELDPILATWAFEAGKTQSLSVMPDGCRDLIVNQPAGDDITFFISHLMPAPESVFVFRGEKYCGVRLRPGARIDLRVIRKRPIPRSLDELAALAQEAASISANVAEALSCLAVVHSAGCAARNLGVSLRTLQRRTLEATGQPPEFWRQLARARKAARMLLSGVPLRETAFDCGYADQAHMTRDLKRWFAMTPGEIATGRDAGSHAAWGICEIGYDAPYTGEHISIR